MDVCAPLLRARALNTEETAIALTPRRAAISRARQASAIWLAGVSLAALVLAGCTRTLPPATSVDVGIVNGTSMSVGLFINDHRIADYPPGGGSIPSLDPRSLPNLPWRVEARSPSGRVLQSLTVQPGELRAGSMTSGSIDLACGNLELWVGDFIQKSLPPAPTPEQPEACDP